jgi:hypothetical protein
MTPANRARPGIETSSVDPLTGSGRLDWPQGTAADASPSADIVEHLKRSRAASRRREPLADDRRERWAELAAWTIRYATSGLAVLPLHSIRDDRCTCGPDCASPGKHPLSRHGHGDATTDLDTIRSWWRRRPWANMGVEQGKRKTGNELILRWAKVRPKAAMG